MAAASVMLRAMRSTISPVLEMLSTLGCTYREPQLKPNLTGRGSL